MRVFINPGHALNGVPDPGAVSPETGLKESDVAAAIGDLVKRYLESAGLECRLLQDDDLWTVVNESNDWDADLFVSIHCNAASSSQANGAECWHFASSSAGKKLAQCIQGQITSSLPLTDRGIKGAQPGVNGLYVLTNTDAVACLVETAFITNAEDEFLLYNNQDDFARAIARGVTDYICGIDLWQK